MRKNIGILAIISFTSLSLISAFTFKQNSKLAHADFACEHSGYHYEELLPEIGTAGHKEFWACCKCHEAFLEKPEKGVFTDQDDSLMTGEIDEEHVAYVSPLEVKSLIYNNRRYYPVIDDEHIPDGVTFYDENMNELMVDTSGYVMSGFGNAVYYTNADSISFGAVSCIEDVSYNEVYGTEGSGPSAVNQSFLTANNISSDEYVEPLSFSTEPNSSDVPTIKGVFLGIIWRAYRSFGFAESKNLFLSCVSYNTLNAYCFDVDMLNWRTINHSIKSNVVVCLSKSFS